MYKEKGKILDNETIELQHKHYEEKRKEKIRILLEERAELMNTNQWNSEKYSKNNNVLNELLYKKYDKFRFFI